MTGEKILGAKEHAVTRVIVPNNDVRTEINKQRARRYALEHGKQILWCFAKDTFPAATLAADPNLPGRKLEFLQHHDRECADLPGLVPLVVGLPVTLSEHVDREKGLLRGGLCTIVGWRVAADEMAVPSNLAEASWLARKETFLAGRQVSASTARLAIKYKWASTGEELCPKVMLQEMVDVVWIRAKDAQWTLPGCPPGVYPIRPVTGTWYVDKNSCSPQLQTHRKQIPLLPGFACTANAAQGGNWSAAITDINIAGGMSPQAAYVSLSRVKEKKSILWYRFELIYL